jgi:hypothetical protein
MRTIRAVIFDRTCREGGAVGLSHAWWSGVKLYQALGRVDVTRGVASWREALEWLGSVEPDARLAEVQFWGHGRWGEVLINREPLDARALDPAHPLHSALSAVRDRLTPDGSALWWFRTCETFGAQRGHDFARAWTSFFGCPAAGHTYIIHAWQSGLHRLAPGAQPDWSDREGLAAGTPERPVRAVSSGPLAPRTITCLRGRIPEGW